MKAGIPVDQPGPRVFAPLARPLLDRRRQLRHGRSAPARYIGEQLKGKPNAGHRRDRRHRQPGADPAAHPGLRRRPEDYPGSKVGPGGRRVHRRVRPGRMANLLQAAPKIDALWNHDDDQGVGVLRRHRAGRPRRVPHGRRRRLAERDGRHQGRRQRAQGHRPLPADAWPPPRSTWPARSARARA